MTKKEKWTCPKCGHHIHSKRERHLEICDGLGPGASKRKKGPGKHWAKGKKLNEEQRLKISQSLTGKPWHSSNEESRRQKISKTMKNNPNAGGYRIGSGRCKGLWYESVIAGYVYLDSSYEHRLAIYLDRKNILWTKNKKKFLYIDESGNSRYYIPDFYLPDLDLWVETKGFETIRDHCKWKHFPHKLKVLFGNDIENLEMEGIRLD